MTPAFTELGGRRPFAMRVSPLDPKRFYYVTRTGLMYTMIKGDTKAPVLALDITDEIGTIDHTNAYSPGGSEEFGIASFTFDPDFAHNGWVFVVFNGRQANESTTTSYLARFTLKADGLTLNRDSQLIILKQVQGTSWLHHFGDVEFGPDGFLYLSSGDGTLNGAAYFDDIRAQNLDDLHGKILRLNVANSTATKPYTIPASNPFVGVAGARGEIYAYGFRNPWRMSFDTVTGNLWLGDVGDAQYEEVNIVEQGGNYGWPIFEGTNCRVTAQCGSTTTKAPVHVVSHNGESIAVIGGFVYHGSAIPSLSGKYIFRVYGRNELYALTSNGGTYTAELIIDNTPNMNSFFTDADQEIYSTDMDGNVYQLVPSSTTGGSGTFPALLSQTGCVRPSKPTVAAVAMVPYGVNSQLWSDGAGKKRWVALPDGKTVTIDSDGDFDFPTGSVLMKSFLFQGKPFETRLLKHHNDGTWTGTTYKWKSDLSDATLVPAGGEDITVKANATKTINWHLPSRSECTLCHTAAAKHALGPNVAQLNGFFAYPNANNKVGQQLATWSDIGMFSAALPGALYDLPTLSAPWAKGVSNVRRARSSLEANCAHCHRPGNDIRATMDLRFGTDISEMAICNEAPRISDLGIAGAKLLAPGHPESSIIPARVSLRGENQMPPLGTFITDGTATLLNGWIKRGDVCSAVPDNDGDSVPNNADNCLNIANANQLDSDSDKFGDRCDGDFNNDYVTDDTDRELITQAVGSSFGDAEYRTNYDFDLNGRVDDDDLYYFNHMLAGHPPGASGFAKVP
ncbi:MAG: PQQ-dependent sugar dehydrogenase [Rhodospirillales bacterium]|nr:PQQ-dependent sugar dehydrogenase [Rhodospirillales bacterium]